MFCPQCGKKCPDDSRFCENCGNPLTPPPPPANRFSPESDPLSATVSEIAESVQRAQPVPSSAYAAPTIVPPPIVVRKKSNAGPIAAVAAVVLLLAAIGGGAFYLFHTRTANETDLTENLMEYMWAYCEADVVDHYDGALPKSYSERGYKIEQKESNFRLQPSQEKDAFSVSGRVNIIDRTNSDASYRVDIEGTVKTNFMCTKYTWDLEYDFEDPPAPAQEGEPAVLPDDRPVEDGGAQTPADSQPGDSAAASGNTASSQDVYLWPTDTQYITNDDLDNFSRKEIMLMRNELYARYGCSFQDEEIRTYFEAQNWYVPNPDLLAIDFQRDWFNDYETTNLDTILNYEKAMGWRK